MRIDRQRLPKKIGGIRFDFESELIYRFAEFPNPASQALHGACVELMASLLPPAVCAKSLIDFALTR